MPYTELRVWENDIREGATFYSTQTIITIIFFYRFLSGKKYPSNKPYNAINIFYIIVAEKIYIHQFIVTLQTDFSWREGPNVDGKKT